jgi:glucose/arabinose dehydrogenase
MRRILFGLMLVPLIACSAVLADDAQVPNANTGGSQQAQANKKQRSDQMSPPSQKNRKQTSTTRSRAPSAPAALPLSSAETYASEHPGNLAISSAPKPAPPPGNSWTGFYVGAGVGAQP